MDRHQRLAILAEAAGDARENGHAKGQQGERDSALTPLVARLERQRLLHHAHSSAFQPVVGTPMEGEPSTPAPRELRLYQAAHLLRQYGFDFEELPFDASGN